MSDSPINRSEHLQALLEDGYEISIEAGYLLIHGVVYVDSEKKVRRGVLISELEMAGNEVIQPKSHVALFSGEFPCNQDGKPLLHLEHGSKPQRITDNMTAQYSFSSKPPGGFQNIYEKMATYADMISRHAKPIDPAATSCPGRVVIPDNKDSVFKYMDTASSRAGINAISSKLNGLRVDIIGMGGTGSYIFDIVAKTPVHLHIYDDDRLMSHNAFRAPGAVSATVLERNISKVEHFAREYGKFRNFIFPHACKLNSSNVDLLEGTDFVFICIDDGAAKIPIVEWLEANQIPFIDVGMGLEVVDEKIRGLVRVTLSTPHNREQIRRKNRINFAKIDDDDVYSQNIQIAELNALNAILAIIKWKKLFGIYSDIDREHSILYAIDGNTLINEDEQ